MALLSMDKQRVKQNGQDGQREAGIPRRRGLKQVWGLKRLAAVSQPHTSAIAASAWIRRALRGLRYVRSLRPFLAFGNFELYLVSLLQALVSL